MKSIVAIFGYNNSRIYDVLKIKNLVKVKTGAEILLIKEGITAEDLEVTPFCFDHKPEDPHMLPSLLSYLRVNDFNLIGCLPFSDKGVIGAAHIAQQLNLFGDDSATSFAMLNKNTFRELESKTDVDPKFYKRPFFALAQSRAQVNEFFLQHGPFFLKPVAEGNSRGCMKIENLADLEIWFQSFSSSLTQGVICEEILSRSDEYSFDGVGGTYWITKKFTTTGPFRAEYQHIIPAPLGDEITQQVHSVLVPLLKNLGSNGGAFHHEFFLLPDDRIASVEPNRRPAGMGIWDLASWAFEEFNPWTRWIDLCTGTSVSPLELKPKTFAGVRAVISKNSGRLKSLPHELMTAQLAARFGKDNFRLTILKSVGDRVLSEPRDNSDFIAMVALRNPNYEALLSDLNAADEIILNSLEVQSCESK
ncbi:MAG: hypothetical protein HQ462_10470 [Deltaproteobacteria bacterium]|nr:hypothetical protein [Deltaproteobacteria bacterium]